MIMMDMGLFLSGITFGCPVSASLWSFEVAQTRLLRVERRGRADRVVVLPIWVAPCLRRWCRHGERHQLALAATSLLLDLLTEICGLITLLVADGPRNGREGGISSA